MVNNLAESNHKVKALLKYNGSYENIPDYQRELINEKLGIKREVIIKYSTID